METSGADVSREGVQRDLLPLIEGCTVTTKYGLVRTDHILFIASGAFHLSRPSDLIPELQGRLPIRVELAARAGYDPRAAVTLWQKMARANGGEPPQFLSTHPSSENRIADLQVYAARVQPLYEQARKR